MRDADAVVRALAESGPCSGADLHDRVGGELFGLWKVCHLAPGLATRIIGRRYVRLDRSVEGFARLSPSILREFVTYTVIGLADRPDELDAAARRLAARTRVISRAKRRVAERFTREVADIVGTRGVHPGAYCVLLAGDVVYDMSHDVTRHESSTGGRVDGSDLDLVVLVADEAPEGTIRELDAAIMQRKWLYLRSPMVREEVDFVIKPLSRLAEQAAFDTFGHMVACKVFHEAVLLHGNRALHEAGLRLLADHGVLDRLGDLRTRAVARRAAREAWLLSLPGERLPEADSQQFYTDDEAAEFEHR